MCHPSGGEAELEMNRALDPDRGLIQSPVHTIQGALKKPLPLSEPQNLIWANDITSSE